MGRYLNPLGRGDGRAYVAGGMNLGLIAPRLPWNASPGGWGNSVNNGCASDRWSGLGPDDFYQYVNDPQDRNCLVLWAARAEREGLWSGCLACLCYCYGPCETMVGQPIDWRADPWEMHRKRCECRRKHGQNQDKGCCPGCDNDPGCWPDCPCREERFFYCDPGDTEKEQHIPDRPPCNDLPEAPCSGSVGAFPCSFQQPSPKAHCISCRYKQNIYQNNHTDLCTSRNINCLKNCLGGELLSEVVMRSLWILVAILAAPAFIIFLASMLGIAMNASTIACVICCFVAKDTCKQHANSKSCGVNGTTVSWATAC
jgi:hypothetical protein